MAKHRNCPNCGAPYEIGENKCPYCGTAYFDMSIIDFDSHEKFYLSIRVNGMLFTQLVKPDTCNVNIESDSVYKLDHKGNKISSFTTANSVSIDVAFHAVSDKDGAIITAKKL